MIPNLTIAVALLLASSSLLPAQDEAASLALLKKPDVPLEQKQEACRHLARVGTAKSVQALAGFLGDAELSQMARHALEPIPDPSVDTALRDALGTVKGRLLIGVIDSIGVRGEALATPALTELLTNPDSEVAQAAALALGKIGTMEAVKALQSNLNGASAIQIQVVCDGLLHSAESLARMGRNEDAFAICKRLLAFPKAPHQVRTAALRGAVHNDEGVGLVLLVSALRGGDEAMFSSAVRISMERNDPAVTPALARELGKLPPEHQILVAGVLAERGDPAGGPALMNLLHTAGTPGRVAAAKALTRLAYIPVIPVLSTLSLESDDELNAVARECLASFPATPADSAITKLLLSDEPEVRRIGAGMLGRRSLNVAVPALLIMAAKDEEESVCVAALNTLRDLAGIDDLDVLLNILLKTGSEAVRQSVTHALVVVCSRQPAVGNEPAPACVDPLVAALEMSSGPAKAALIQVLRRVGGTKAQKAVRRAGGAPVKESSGGK